MKRKIILLNLFLVSLTIQSQVLDMNDVIKILINQDLDKSSKILNDIGLHYQNTKENEKLFVVNSCGNEKENMLIGEVLNQCFETVFLTFHKDSYLLIYTLPKKLFKKMTKQIIDNRLTYYKETDVAGAMYYQIGSTSIKIEPKKSKIFFMAPKGRHPLMTEFMRYNGGEYPSIKPILFEQSVNSNDSVSGKEYVLLSCMKLDDGSGVFEVTKSNEKYVNKGLRVCGKLIIRLSDSSIIECNDKEEYLQYDYNNVTFYKLDSISLKKLKTSKILGLNYSIENDNEYYSSKKRNYSAHIIDVSLKNNGLQINNNETREAFRLLLW